LVGDPVRLEQIIVNLLSNAIKFTEHGEIEVQVALQERADSKVCLRFSIRDTGIGIPNDKRDRIFAPFEQGDASTTRRYGGTGLGLAIVTELVKLMDGRIWVESDPGHGSTFHFTAWLGEEMRPSVCMRNLLSSGMALAGTHVLVVDDNATTRDILTDTLREWNMKPASAPSAAAALEELSRAAAAGTPYALALIDIQMPGEDGHELLAKIRNRPELKELRTLMLASADQTGRRDAGSRSELCVAVGKPVKGSELFDAILFTLDLHPGTHVSRRGAGADIPSFEQSPSGNRQLRILLAEDNPVNQMVASERLKQAGHAVVVVENGRQAVEAVESEKFDVAFLDVHMPEMDGFAALAHIRRREQKDGGHLPVIALTANAMKGDRERCLNAGFDNYVPKPIRFEELFAALERLVSHDASRPALPPTPLPIPVDGAKLFARFDHDATMVRKMTEMFLRNCPRWLADIRKAIDAGDSKKLHMTAHSLKGAVGHFSDAEPFELAMQLEAMGKKHDLSEARTTMRTLETAMKSLQESLNGLLAELSINGRQAEPVGAGN